MGFLTPSALGRRNYRPTVLQFRQFEHNARQDAMRKTRTIRRLQRILHLRRAAETEQREAVLNQQRLATTLATAIVEVSRFERAAITVAHVRCICVQLSAAQVEAQTPAACTVQARTPDAPPRPTTGGPRFNMEELNAIATALGLDDSTRSDGTGLNITEDELDEWLNSLFEDSPDSPPGKPPPPPPPPPAPALLLVV